MPDCVGIMNQNGFDKGPSQSALQRTLPSSIPAGFGSASQAAGSVSTCFAVGLVPAVETTPWLRLSKRMTFHQRKNKPNAGKRTGSSDLPTKLGQQTVIDREAPDTTVRVSRSPTPGRAAAEMRRSSSARCQFAKRTMTPISTRRTMPATASPRKISSGGRTLTLAANFVCFAASPAIGNGSLRPPRRVLVSE